MDRRRFVSAGAKVGGCLLSTRWARALGLNHAAAGEAGRVPTLDAHVHLFDPTRAGGVPWPKPDDAIYKPALPERLRAIAEPLGVVGAIAVEASPLDADNDWLLNVVTGDPFMVGFVGDLVPGATGFRARLEVLHRSRLFLGIRYGNLWDRDLAVDRLRPGFREGLRALSEAGLTFETANPDASLIAAVLAVAQEMPELRIVIDHLPHVGGFGAGATAERAYGKDLEELARSPRVFAKMSEVLDPGVEQGSVEPYRARLDRLWGLFGPERVVFGSDWPNSDHVAPYAETIGVVREYVGRRAPGAADAVFFRNSRRAYGWVPRTAAQGLRG